MWKLKSLFLIPVMLLLVLFLPIVLAGTQQILYDDACLIYGPRVNVSVDNSTYGRRATILGGVEYITAVKQVGDASAFFDGSTNNPLIFSRSDGGSGCLSPINITVAVWSNMSLNGIEQIQHIFSTRGSSLAEGDYWAFFDTTAGTVDRIDFNYADSGASSIVARADPATAFFAGNHFSLLIFEVNITGTTANLKIYLNNTVIAENSGSVNIVQTNEDFGIGDGIEADNGQRLVGGLNELVMWNRTLTNEEKDFMLTQGQAGISLTPEGEPEPSFTNNIINNTVPRINDVVQINITITDADDISGYIFSWDNGSGTFINNSFISIESDSLTIANVSVNKTIFNVSGTVIKYLWYANDTLGNMENSSIFTVTVAGTTAPNITINSNNFFGSDNKTIIGLNASQVVLINLSFADDIELFGFEMNITDFNGLVIYNLTNTSLSGATDSFFVTINVSGIQGFYNVSIVGWDTHTAKVTYFNKIIDGLRNYIMFDDKIRITAEGAIFSRAIYEIDKYTFQFNYIPFFAPKNKVFYVESDGELYLIMDSPYKGHFVDWKNKRWIDFEGIKEIPTITKINNKRWRIEFTNSDSKLIFSSIGGLNSKLREYQYYLSNVSMVWELPKTDTTGFLGDSFSVSLNVTGNGRNLTQFSLYNSTHNLIQKINISNNGTGTHTYDATFSSLVDLKFFVNATHFDITGENKTFFTTRTFNRIALLNCNNRTNEFKAINFTIIDEQNGSRIRGTSTSTFNFNGSSPAFTLAFTKTNQDNFSVCITPPGQTLFGDYNIVYSATGYQERRFENPDATFSNATALVNLNLLSDSVGITGNFRVIDSFQEIIAGVEVTVKIESTNTTIEVRDTDDSGFVSFWLDPDTTYSFKFVKSGFQTETFSLRVTSTDIRTVTLLKETTAIVESLSTGVQYNFFPSNAILENKTSFDFVFNLTSTFWNITGCTLRIKNASETFNSSSLTFNGSICQISINFNTGNQSTIFSEATYELNGTFNNTVSVQYTVKYIFIGTFSLKNFLDDISAFSSAGFNDFTRMLIAFVITFGVVGVVASSLVGIREPESLIVLAWSLVLFFSFIGWYTLNFNAIPEIRGLATGWLKQYIIFLLFSLGASSYMIRRHI